MGFWKTYTIRAIKKFFSLWGLSNLTRISYTLLTVLPTMYSTFLLLFSHEATKPLDITTFYGFLIALFFMVLSFLYSLFITPREIWNELNEKINNLNQELNRLQHAPRPNILFVDERIKKDIKLFTYEEYNFKINPIEMAKIDVAQVSVSNQPERYNKGLVALNAHSIIKYYYREILICKLDYGRWADNQQPAGLKMFETLDPLLRRSLYANGEKHWIDLVLKHEDDHYCYAFNAHTCRLYTDWKDPHLEIKADEFKVKVIINAEELEIDSAVGEFVIKNHGVGGSIEITRLS